MDLSKDFNFEESLARLEKIAESLENNDTTIEQSVTLFQEGVQLSKECSAYLDNVKQKTITLTDAEKEEI